MRRHKSVGWENKRQRTTIQCLTIEEILDGEAFDGPITGGLCTYKNAQKIEFAPGQEKTAL